MTYAIAKKRLDGIAYVGALTRVGDIKELIFAYEFGPLYPKPIVCREFKTEAAARDALERMKTRGYDDYSVIELGTYL